ncbi:AmpE protein [Halopseudomonas litoralis]|uniref:AmpE protein n=1 Tax=Halopseudomonas litoralis TaxID=797277 RepID=A0A1H1TV33_9GAMM|nr:regulatory signaling modulator protein AmpE [Halopseudomonas litoralis]SDS63479.1 AmpE protein [Halopseudomonas litoralis]
MKFLVLLLVALTLLWTPWRTGYPRDFLIPWVARTGRLKREWIALIAVLMLLAPLGLLLWWLEGIAYGLFTLLLHVGVLLLCVGRHDPLGRMTDDFMAAWHHDDLAAAGLVAEQQLDVRAGQPDLLPALIRTKIVATSLQDYFVPAFWYLLLGPLGALAWRLLLLSSQHDSLPAARSAAMLAHALEWIPARLLGLSFALVGQFDSTLRTLRSLATDWELGGGELAARCAQAALPETELEPISVPEPNNILTATRQLMIRAILTWAVVIAFLSMLS